MILLAIGKIDLRSINYLVIEDKTKLDPLGLIDKFKDSIHNKSTYFKFYILNFAKDSRASQIISCLKAIKKDGLNFDFKIVNARNLIDIDSTIREEALYPLDCEVLLEDGIRKTKILERLKLKTKSELNYKKVLIFGAHSGIAKILFDIFPKRKHMGYRQS